MSAGNSFLGVSISMNQGVENTDDHVSMLALSQFLNCVWSEVKIISQMCLANAHVDFHPVVVVGSTIGWMEEKITVHIFVPHVIEHDLKQL